LNLCFLRPTRFHNRNGKSISSAIFAQHTAECRRVHWRHLANTIELVLPSADPTPQPNSKSIGSAVHAQHMAECRRAHWRHLTNTSEIVHAGATWLIRLNSRFLQPTQVQSPNGRLIGSAVSAQITAECPILYNGTPLLLKIVPSHSGIWTQSNTVHWPHQSSQPKQQLNQFSHFCMAH